MRSRAGECISPTVLNWIRAFAQEHQDKPKPTGRANILELDDMWHYLKTERCKLWIWKALDQDTGQLLDWECGRRDKATLWDTKMYCTDKMAPYAVVIPQDKLVQSKTTTHDTGFSDT